MGVKIAFYSMQALRSIKTYIYLIIGISLSVSLLMGMFNYMSSTSSYNLQNSLENVHDITIESTLAENKTQIYDRFAGNESFIIDNVLDSKLDFESVSNYAHFTTSYTASVSMENYSRMTLDFLFYDANFLDSSRFDKYFTIIDGRTPHNNQEYLIDVWMAMKLNFTISNNISFPLTARKTFDSPRNLIPFTNNSIVGIYVPNFENYEVASGENYYCPFPYHPNYNEILLNDTFYPIGPIFGYIDIQSNNEIHPINRYLMEVESFLNNSYSFLDYEYGLGVNYDRASINPFRISQESDDLFPKYLDFRKDLYSSQEIRISVSIFVEMRQFSDDFTITRLSFFALIIPIFLFAIGLSNFVVSTNFTNRQEEFGRFQIKGYPKSMIIWQLTFESLYVGLSAFILSIPISIGIFHLVQPFLNSVFIIVPVYSSFIPIKFVFSNYLLGLGVALAVSFLGNILTFIKIFRLKLASVNARRQGLTLEVGYDENMFEESAQHRKGGKLSAYLDQTKLMEKSIPKISYFFMAAALIPFIAIFLRYLGYLPNASDQMILVAQGISQIMKVILFFATLSPILLVYGLLRFFIQESPQRYAKISKFFAKPLLKDQDYLVGLEMLRRKPYILVIFMLGLFTTSLVFGNINRHTQVREVKFYDNIDAVSDINITLNGTINNRGNTVLQNVSFTDLDDYTKSLLNLKDEYNQKIVQNLAHMSFFPSVHTYTSYEGDIYIEYDWSSRSILCATNLSAYSAIINPEIKNFFPSIESSIQKLQDFRALSNNDTLGMIVTPYFLEKSSLEIGDTYDFKYTTNLLNMTISTFTIVDVINFIPAVSEHTFEPLYANSYNIFSETRIREETRIGLCDFSDIPFNDSFFITESLATLMHSNSTLSSSEISLTETLTPIVESFAQNIELFGEPTSTYSYYDPNWNSGKLNYFEYDSLISVNLLYLDLIIIGVFVAIAIATTIVGLEKKNLHFDGLLLSRGFGRRKIMLMITSQIIIIFLFSVILGGIGALITGWAWMEAYLGTRLNYSWYGCNISEFLHFPVQMSAPELLLILGLDFCLTVILYLIFFIIQERKSISGFLIKF
ncbi:MAG: FtsX-like permease family protein [Promethearchaeota archaeon]